MHYVRVIRRVTLKKEIFALEQISKRKKRGRGIQEKTELAI